jgi:DNA modification methylase
MINKYYINNLNTNRNFIGIELNDDYFNIAKDRIEKREFELKESKKDLW